MNNNVHIATDIIVLDGMVADSLEAASPYENVHSKILIDATTLTERDPRSSIEPLEGSFKQEVPAWRQGLEAPPAFDNLEAVLGLEDVSDARMLRESMRMTVEAIVQNKLRAILTLLGISIGVFSVIGVMTAIRTLETVSYTHLTLPTILLV